MRKGKIILTAILILFMASAAVSQNHKASVVKGTVIDAETREPLFAASVYFAETTLGTTAQEKGEYSITLSNPGNYELVVSMIGYKTTKTSMFIEEGINYTYNFKLVPQAMNVEPVVVEGESQAEWRRALRIFTRKIMGVMESEDDCVIENKEYIDFKWSKDTLKAFTRKPVTLVNSYLGYKIILEIQNYKYDPVSSYQEYSIYSRFIELTPENKSQKSKWDENREVAYMESPLHFLWALKHNRIKEEGFEIHFVNKPSLERKNELQEIRNTEDMKHADQFLNEALYSFKGYIKIEYRNQISFAIMICPFFTLDENGIADNHLPFSCVGYWSNFGLGAMLPRDYLPESLKNKL